MISTILNHLDKVLKTTSELMISNMKNILGGMVFSQDVRMRELLK